MIDRSKYKKANSAEMQKMTNEIKSREGNSTRSAFLKVDAGINVFRIFPAPLKAKSSLFMFPKTTAFLPFEEDEKDEDGNKTGKIIVKRRAIFNAKVHGGLDRDIVEEYMEAVKEKLAAKYSDKKALYKALSPLTDWKTGIKPNNSWCCYARKKAGDSYLYGRLQFTNGVKKQLDTLCLRQSDSGEAMVVDLLSDPDKGISIQWINNPQAEDLKARNKLNLLFEQESPLSDEELEWLEKQDSLESLFQNSFTRKDFERELKGLQKFDSDSGFDVFETPSFQSIVESCRKEVEAKIPEEETAEASNKKEEKELEMPEVLQEMDKKTLKELVDLLSLDVEIKITTPPTKIKKAILAAISETYEVTEPDDISAIIENAFEENSSEKEDEEQEEEEEQEEVEESEEAEEEPVEETKPKASKLLEKYRQRNKK